MKYLLVVITSLVFLVNVAQADIRGDASVACVQAHNARIDCEITEWQATGFYLDYSNKRDEARSLYNAEPEGERKALAKNAFDTAESFGGTGFGKWHDGFMAQLDGNAKIALADYWFNKGEQEFADQYSNWEYNFELSIPKHLSARNAFILSKAYYENSMYPLNEAAINYERVIWRLQPEM